MTKHQALLRASRILQTTYVRVLPALAPGRTERDVARQINRTMRELGADGTSFPTIVAFGRNSAEPHHQTGDTKLRRGQLILLDFGAKVDGWCSDQSRTFAFGTPTLLQRKRYTLVRRAQSVAIRAIRPGAESRRIDGIARGVITHAGLGKRFMHGVGHGFGRRIHEPPWLSPARPSRQLRVGDTVTVEPGVYFRGWGGVRIEDMVLVTRTGHRVLTAKLPTTFRLTIDA